MDFSGLTNYLTNIDFNLIPDCEIAVYKDHNCIYKNSFSKNDYNPEEAEKLEAAVRKDFHKLMTGQAKVAAKAAGRAVDVSADDFNDED